MRRLVRAFVATNNRRQFSQSQSNCYMSFYHERLESKMRNLIFVKYDITLTELLFAQSLQSIRIVYVDTPTVILLVTVFFITKVSCMNHVLPILNTLRENEEFSKAKND